jgi:hypothetical protein
MAQNAECWMKEGAEGQGANALVIARAQNEWLAQIRHLVGSPNTKLESFATGRLESLPYRCGAMGTNASFWSGVSWVGERSKRPVFQLIPGYSGLFRDNF